MTTVLTNEEKVNIVNQHIRALEFAGYNADLDMIEAEAANASAEIKAEITARKNSVAVKITALEAEKATLTE